MLDVKILSAVFASLVAAAVMVNGGGVDYNSMDIEDVENVESGFNLNEFTEDPIEQIREHFRSYPEPENSFEAHLTVENLHQQSINLREAGEIKVEGLNQLDLGANQVYSEEEIVLHGYRGTVEAGNITTLEGGINSLTSSDVNVTGTMNVNEEVNTSQIEVNDVEKTPLTFSDVGGSIESSDASTQFGEGSRILDANSFSGDMKIFLDNNTIVLDGRVDSLEAGSFSFGS